MGAGVVVVWPQTPKLASARSTTIRPSTRPEGVQVEPDVQLPPIGDAELALDLHVQLEEPVRQRAAGQG